MSNIFRQRSVWFIIISNLVVVFAAKFFKWSVLEVVVIYIVETFIVGLFNILKIAIFPKTKVLLRILFYVPFFIFTYNFAILIQFGFLAHFFGETFQTIYNNWEAKSIIKEQIPAVLLMILSQGYSLIYYFIVMKEYEKMDMNSLFLTPFKRIFIQHFVVLIGGTAIYMLKTPIFFLYVLFAMKLLFDIQADVKAHKEQIINKN
jgi:hypothetical protein